MAHQAKQSLDTIAGELEAAQSDDPKSKWADATQDALDGVEQGATGCEGADRRAVRRCRRSPDQIMSGDDQRALDRLRRRQQLNRTAHASVSAIAPSSSAASCPAMPRPSSARSSAPRSIRWAKADDQMKAKDPSGTRESTRAAAETLAKARERARSAARQAQESSRRRRADPHPGRRRVPRPEKFREDLQQGCRRRADKARWLRRA